MYQGQKFAKNTESPLLSCDVFVSLRITNYLRPNLEVKEYWEGQN